MDTTTAAADSGSAALAIIPILIGVAWAAFNVYLVVRIVRKAGYSGWWALAGIVPIFGYIMLIVFAFSTWPVEGNTRRVTYAPPAGPTDRGAPPPQVHRSNIDW